MKTNFNNFLVFIFSLIPGAGYMYLGLMQKGLEAMLLFFASVTVFGWLDLPQLIPMISIPLWFYCFFDTFAQRGRLVQGEEIDDRGFLNLMARLGEERYYYFGVALLAIGILALLGNLNQDLLNWWSYGHYFRKYLLSALLIAGGLFLLFRARSPRPDSVLNDQESENLSEIETED